MKKISSFLKLLFISSLFLFTSVCLAQASDLPKGITPQQGKAETIFDYADGKVKMTLTFWNVGEMGGGDYGKASLTIGCFEAPGGAKCSAPTTTDGIFTGGPNGKMTGGANTAGIPLVNGTYFDTSAIAQAYKGIYPSKLPVDNPEIFSGWTNPPKEEKYIFGSSGAAFSDIYGQVECNWPRGDGSYDVEDWHSCKLNTTLPAGTHIKSMEKSGAIISYSDMSIYVLKPESEIVLGDPSERESQIKLLAGVLWVNVKKMMKDGSMQVEMSQAVAGIKGTRFIVSDNGKESTLKVTEGTVNFRLKNSSESATVTTGESITATSGKFLPKTKFDPVQEETKWQNMVDQYKKTNPAKATKNTLQSVYIVGGIVIVILSITFFVIKRKK